MKRLFFFFAACLMAAGQPSVWAQPSVSPLELWVGSYPSDRLGLAHQSIWQTALLERQLKVTLPANEYRRLQRFKVESKIEKIQGFLVIHICMAHGCSSDLATLFFEIDQKKLWVAMAQRDDRRLSVRWYSSGDSYARLPVEIQRRFTERLGS